jgi:hypothetical protein
LAFFILDSHEEELVSQSKRQVFEKRRVQMRPQPSVELTTRRALDVHTSGLPATGKLWCHFGHGDVMHLYSSNH